MAKVRVVQMLSAVTTVSTGEGFDPIAQNLTFQGIGTTTSGAGSATVVVEASLDGTNFNTLATITLPIVDENTPFADSFAINASWINIRGRVSAISGTGTSVNLFMAGPTKIQ